MSPQYEKTQFVQIEIGAAWVVIRGEVAESKRPKYSLQPRVDWSPMFVHVYVET